MTGDADSLVRAFRRAGTEARFFNREINQTFRGLSRGLGFAAAAGGIASVGLALRSTVQRAIDFESSFAGVRKTVDASEPEFKALADGFRAMSREIPVSVDELNRIGEAAGQLGIQKDAILSFTRTVADLGVTTNLATSEAADALARIANITGLPQDEFDRLGSTIVDLGNKLAATESEIVALSLRLAGAGNQIGLSEAQIAGFAGALASVGLEAEAGGSAFSRVFATIANSVASGGKQLDQFAKIAGQSSDAFRQQFGADAAAAVTAFVEGLARIGEQGGNVFAALQKVGLGEIRVRDALLRAAGAGDLLRRSLDTANKAFDANSALAEEASKRYETSASRLQVFRNRVGDLQITLGEALVPALESVIAPLSEWLESTDNQARLQENLNRILSDARAAIQGVADVVLPLANGVREAADRIGGMRQAVRLLLAVMVANRVAGFTDSILGLGTAAGRSRGQVRSLQSALLRLGTVGLITIGIEVVLNRKEISDKVDEFLRSNNLGFLATKKLEIPVGTNIVQLQAARDQVAKLRGESDFLVRALDKIIEKMRAVVTEGVKSASRVEDIRQGARAQLAETPKARAAQREQEREQRARLTPTERAAQGNQFFDNAISRRLSRAQLLDLEQQVAELDQVARLIQERIAKTKDVTRRLNLEDQLLQVQAQAREVRQQIADAFMESLRFGFDKAQLTSRFDDDLKLLDQMEKAVQARIRSEGRTLELERELLDIRQQRLQVASQFKSAALDKLTRKQENLDTSRALEDALRNLQTARQLGGTGRIREATRAVQDARIGRQQFLLSGASVTPSTQINGGFNVRIGSVNLPGVKNAKQLLAELQRLSKTTAAQQRGRNPGVGFGGV